MTYLLDTNTCIGVLTNRVATLAERWKQEKSPKRELVHQKLEVFFSRFKSMPFDDVAAHSYGVIRAALETAGQSIGPNDTLIAAIALANGLTVVTHNTREFRRVPGLLVEDWET